MTAAHWVIWQILDGKRGHTNQIIGVTEALAQQTAVRAYPIEPTRSHYALQWLQGRFPQGEQLPDPHLIFAAGHATHLAALAAQRARGGRLVLFMRPSWLPLRLCDLCLIPRHDNPPQSDHVLVTTGAPNRVRACVEHDSQQALILLGGPSRHHMWDDQSIIETLHQLAARLPHCRIQVATSPRTPSSCTKSLAAMPKVELVHWQNASSDWLPQALCHAGQIWVTEDSVSMLYEALSSGAQVGLLPLPRKGRSRVSKGVDQLLAEQYIITFEQWLSGHTLPTPPPLNEATRCANEILKRWQNS